MKKIIILIVLISAFIITKAQTKSDSIYSKNYVEYILATKQIINADTGIVFGAKGYFWCGHSIIYAVYQNNDIAQLIAKCKLLGLTTKNKNWKYLTK
jgi:hypothetical protein